MSGRGGPRSNFPQWNYGHTLGPSTQANGGNYTQFSMQQNQPPQSGGLVRPQGVGVTPMPTRGGRGRGGGQGRGSATVNIAASTIQTAKTTIVQPQAGIREDKIQSSKLPEPLAAVQKIPSENTKPGAAKEDGEIVERPINEILQGRNPIMHCNDESKARNLHMEWEQVSETGPPHDKTFTWSLKMGDFLTMGSGNSKKGAKNKAAEEMVKKLDQLPKIAPKRSYNQAMGGPPFMGRGGGRGRGRGRGGGFGNVPAPHQVYENQFPKKPKKTEAETKESTEKVATPAAEGANNPLHPAQNNPISKLYEHSKKQKLPEPIFEVVQEEVLETRKTTQGFNYKKTKFIMQCEILGKKYLGESMNKKTAKFNAAASAWADISGVGQDHIANLLAATPTVKIRKNKSETKNVKTNMSGSVITWNSWKPVKFEKDKIVAPQISEGQYIFRF